MTECISVDDAARRLGIQPSTLRRWVHDRKIEFVKVGRRVVFRQETLEQIVTSGLRPAIGEKA